MPLQRVTDPADPQRCKAPTAKGQCFNLAEEGSQYCLAHGRPSLGPSPTKRMYLLANLQSRTRLGELAEHDAVKSLREEIAITRMMIEKQFNQIKTDDDWQLKWPAIQQGILTVHKLVKDCHVIEQNLGVMLTKQALMALVSRICQIIIEKLEGVEGYEEIANDVARELVALVSGATNEGVVRSVALIEGPSR